MRAEELALPGAPEKFVELIEGELVQTLPPSRKHNVVVWNLVSLFRELCGTRPELDFGGDNEGFLVRRDPDTLLSPDACLYRLRPELEKTWLEFAPEIAVEVLSPSNHPAELAYKRHAYFEAGAEQFWVVDPEKKQIQFYHRNGRLVTVTGDETLEGEGIATGMRISLAKAFRERSTA